MDNLSQMFLQTWIYQITFHSWIRGQYLGLVKPRQRRVSPVIDPPLTWWQLWCVPAHCDAELNVGNSNVVFNSVRLLRFTARPVVSFFMGSTLSVGDISKKAIRNTQIHLHLYLLWAFFSTLKLSMSIFAVWQFVQLIDLSNYQPENLKPLRNLQWVCQVGRPLAFISFSLHPSSHSECEGGGPSAWLLRPHSILCGEFTLQLCHAPGSGLQKSITGMTSWPPDLQLSVSATEYN